MNNTAGITPEANRWFHRARQLQKEQLRQLAQQGTLASRISALVHMLQCERGASNLWLCSAGRLYAAECRAGSALVDEQLIAFREALEAVRECASGALCWRIASALWYLEQLLTLRCYPVDLLDQAEPEQMSHLGGVLLKDRDEQGLAWLLQLAALQRQGPDLLSREDRASRDRKSVV